jgi:tRNA-2-methylthio-N6-dimethylallyladenosine synthase
VPDERPRLERLSGLLEARATAGPARRHADVVVFNTCAVRENADNRLYGNLGHLKPVKDATPACRSPSAAAWRRRTSRSSPQGALGRRRVRHPQRRLLPGAARAGPRRAAAQVELLESLEVFPSTLPARRESPYSAWVSISVGCDNTCTFCIVPSLRGKEEDRRPEDVLAEVGGWPSRACSR